MGRARDLANILSSSGNVALDSEMGLTLITPTSVAATGGSVSVSTNGAVSFTSASAISLNGCFTSTYENYKVLFSLSITTGTPNLTFRFRAAGSDNSTAGYFLFGDKTGGASANIASTSQTSMLLGPASTPTNNGILEIFKPQLTETKAVRASYYYSNNGENYDLFCGTSITTSNDGFSLITASSTMTGTLSVYGYRK
jgi:hypothetical protein